MRVWRKKTFLVSVPIIIMAVTLTLLLLYFHGKSNMEAEPEEWHMIGDGVYFNVYTEDAKGQEMNGIFENITSDTVFYASVQNSDQERCVKLACYLNYERVPIEMLDSSYDNDQILLEDKDNITIPFKLAYRIGQIGYAHQQLMLVTIDYQQADINGERFLAIETEEGHTTFGIIMLKAPETKGKYEICALLVPNPESSNEFTFLENAYRFTLTVE